MGLLIFGGMLILFYGLMYSKLLYEREMMRIYYITRTYPGRNNGGGGTSRKGVVNALKNYGYDVWIVSPNNKNNKIDVNDELKHILLPHVGLHKLFTAFEYVGLVDDYLEWWAIQAAKYLKNIVHKEDIMFATSGGELGCIILGKLLKEKNGCKLVVNFHDPTDFTTVFGEVTNVSSRNIPHKLRDKTEEICLNSADIIVTSSANYKNALMKKYPYMDGKIIYNYFGYIEKINNINKKKINTTINIVYGGSMRNLQSPEILAEAARGLDNINITYIGNWRDNKNLKKYENYEYVELKDAMSFEDYIDYMLYYADIGFVSLQGHLSKLCVPHKLYELINLGIPILAAIEGDAKEIIINNEYGIVSDYNILSLHNAIIEISNKENYIRFRNNIVREKADWSMDKQINVLMESLKNLK